MDELLSEAKVDEPIDFNQVLGRSKDGQWVVDVKNTDELLEEEDEATDGETEKENLPTAGPSQVRESVEIIVWIFTYSFKNGN